MIGLSNAQCGTNKFYNDADTVEMTFVAGENINTGDLVKIMSIDAPDEIPRYVGDGNAEYQGTYSMPTHPIGNKAIYQCFHMNTNSWQGNTNLFSTFWSSSELYITDANTRQKNNVQISAYPSNSWGEPIHIGDGYWLIVGNGSSSTGILDRGGVTYNYPAQILLAYVNPSTGVATRCDVRYITGGMTYCYAGKPIICRISDDEFVMVYEAVASGTYNCFAQYFKIKKTRNEADTAYTGAGEIELKESQLNMYAASGYFVFLGHGAHFVDRENRCFYTLVYTTDYKTYYYMKVTVSEDGILKNTPMRALLAKKGEDLLQMDRWTDVNSYPITMPYYNNFGVYNHIETKDNVHYLHVMNYAYHDFAMDYTTGIMTDTIHAIYDQTGRTQSGRCVQTNNYRYRDYDLQTLTYWSHHCREATNTATSIPWLWKTGEHRYLMAYTSYGTDNYDSTSLGCSWRHEFCALLDYFDETHSLKKTTTLAYSSWAGGGTSYPEAAQCRPFCFTNSTDNIQFHLTRWISGNNWSIYNHYYLESALAESQKDMRAWLADSDMEQCVEDYRHRATIFGIALNTADAGDHVTIKTGIIKENHVKKEEA